MSTNVSFSGVSIKILEDKEDNESIIDIAKILEYDEPKESDLDDLFYEPKTKQWQLYKDYEGVIGLVYLIDNERDVFDIDFGQSLEQLNEILGELHPDVREHFMDKDASNVKAFALIYYNGSENPFKF
jgi:hypothetical protein